ncbi:MAG: peptide deformylase [Campylobacterales bacterium]|nr:peptide deformylase [Campylobacterales bacterium]
MTLEVVKYPNPLLKKVSEEVTQFDKELGTFLDDMYDTMIEYNGIGLAAVQVGVLKRALVINLPREEDEIQHREDVLELINPTITEMDGEIVYQEGCLSVPETYEDVTRAQHVIVQYQDRNGENQILEATDLLAIAVQHEIDHLNGKLFVERLPMLKRKKFEKEWKKANKKK